MRSVMLSIQPKWCELIANGKKTVEVRKTRPKLETPFRCYIYCTKSNKEFLQSRNNCLFYCENRDFIGGHGCGLYQRLNGKVIGEFVCDHIGYVRNYGDMVDSYDCIASCLSAHEIIEYAKDKNGNFVYTYGWHISDLVIYDEPLDINDFVTEGDCTCEKCKECKYFDKGNGFNVEDDCRLPYEHNFKTVKPLFRPPQSWCYVEKGGER